MDTLSVVYPENVPLILRDPVTHAPSPYGRAGIDVSDGWDSEMIEYAVVLPFKDEYRMWYTGIALEGQGLASRLRGDRRRGV